ncbi:hypothetical protein [Poriferisphaera sp. WC338]|uniref:hypothetical protein n=1 Tax=Poriferisphaera sp. WC338 TaxID=3425129 RepID=UPI003D816656
MSLHRDNPIRRRAHRERGAAALLAMMFLVIFGSLATAMAIVSQGNLSTADSHLKINRALAAAETGMHFMVYRINEASSKVRTQDGLISHGNAQALWTQVREELYNSLKDDLQYDNKSFGFGDGGYMAIPEIPVGPKAPTFSATLAQHPLVDENYGSDYYNRPPYSQYTPAVSQANPLDATWVRLTVTSHVGPEGAGRVSRTIKLDFKISKKIRYALLSSSRVMIGRNVIIDGPVGSRFDETHIENGHPIQMVSDFRGLHASLDSKLDALVGSLVGNETNHDTDGDNRINVNNPTELGDLNAETLDVNGDGYIDEFDMFLAEFGQFDSGENLTRVSVSNLTARGVSDVAAAQVLELIDTFGDPNRAGYNDGYIDSEDRYAKIRGEVYVTADRDGWNSGAADPNENGSTAYQDYFQGGIAPDYNNSALTFQATQNDAYQFQPEDFDGAVANLGAKATTDLIAQATPQANSNPDGDPDKPIYDSDGVFEAVPFGAAHPYDYYERPVYENMTFTDVKIPKGTNALFRNCTFRGVTYIETQVENTDEYYNYGGMLENNKSDKFPDYTNTKTISNNLRFDGCTFEGGIVTQSPKEFTHVRNKIAFTGQTQFKIEDSDYLSDAEKALYKRSTILAPNYSIEMGTFDNPADANETINLSGTIVAGLIDMRGQVKINGSVITTFQPKSGEGNVKGDTSPQFNTTIGYFSESEGDLEAAMPTGGYGVIQIKYDPTIPLPDGIMGPIEVKASYATYTEAGAS